MSLWWHGAMGHLCGVWHGYSQYVVRVNNTTHYACSYHEQYRPCTILVHTQCSLSWSTHITAQLQATFVQICYPETWGGYWQYFDPSLFSSVKIVRKVRENSIKTLKKSSLKMLGTKGQWSLLCESRWIQCEQRVVTGKFQLLFSSNGDLTFVKLDKIPEYLRDTVDWFMGWVHSLCFILIG